MADFELAVSKTISNEGGDKYTETPLDRGGATKYGISSKFIINQSVIGLNAIILSRIIGTDKIKCDVKEIIKVLTLEQAKKIYKHFFWDANRYGEIEDQEIAEKVFDMAVLIGPFNANKMLQRCFIIVGYFNLKDDGICRLHTIDMINTNYESNIIYVYKNLLCEYFINICNKDKSQSKFLLGWLNRVMP